MRRPGVTAVDVGYKVVEGQPTDQVAIRVHVERKIPMAQLPEGDAFNDTDRDDETVGDFPVDVIEATYGLAAGPVVLDHDNEAAVEAVDRRSVVSPLIGGISCGNPRATAGTLGAIVFDTTTCQPMILSNWHVLVAASAAAVGESITQPGRVDGGLVGANTVATLTRMQLDSRMDAAVATLSGARTHSRDMLGLGTIAGTDSAALGMNVVKSGRTTGITRGVVDGVALSTRINYGDPGTVRFSGQIRIVPHPPWPTVDTEVSRGGDSGSVWLNEANNKAIGLHFAGETDPAPTNENAICSPIEPIMDELGFSFFPVVCEPPQPPPAPSVHPLIRLLCARFPFLCGPGGLFGPQGEAVGPGAPADLQALIDLLAGGAGGGSGCGCRCCCGCGGCGPRHRGGQQGADELAKLVERLLG
jgi:endonuclease G